MKTSRTSPEAGSPTDNNPGEKIPGKSRLSGQSSVLRIDKKSLFGWVMFDFANSAYTTLVVTFIYGTYFAKAIAPDEISGTALWSRGVTITALSVALLSPLIGAVADKTGLGKKMLFAATVVSVLGSALLFFPVKGQIWFALSVFVVSNIAYELTCVLYNAFLPQIAPKEKIGTISGFGWGMGYIGGLLAMIIAMVTLVSPEVPWFGISKEAGAHIRATNILVAIWFLVFSIPMFVFVKPGIKKADKTALSDSVKSAFSEIYQTFREIRNYRQIVRLLIARLVYNDGLVTIFAFGGIYAAGTFHFSFNEIMIFGIVINVCAGFGALVMGLFDDRLGGKRTIQISNVFLAFACLMAVLAPGKAWFWAAGIMVGFFAGPNQSASRSLLGRFVPKEKQGQFFGFFAFSGKLTAFMGPFLLGLVTQLFDSQRVGMSTILLFFIVGGALLARVDEKAGIKAS